jgi:hypothetical protein
MKTRRVAILLWIILICMVSLGPANSVMAQFEIGAGWSEPLNLSNSPTSSSNWPTIVSDRYGDVHVFWSQYLSGGQATDIMALQSENAIMYRRLQDGIWTDPTDIVYGGQNSRLENPGAIVEENGLLHLVWIQNGNLNHSSVPVWNSTDVRNWSMPEVLVRGLVGKARLFISHGQVMVLYTLLAGESPGLYTAPVDSDNETLPALIWTGGGSFVPNDLGIAVDERDRVHVVWSVTPPMNPAAIAVRYANSDNGGVTWSDSRLVATTTEEEDSLQHAVPWVAARGPDEIHIQWAQGIQAYRWHQFSSDGGKTWTRPYQIWPDLISQTGSQAVGLDGEGTLYWADVLRYPNGAYLIRWTGREWQRPELFFSIVSINSDVLDYRVNAHGLRMTITEGNSLHVVFKDQDRPDIWYMHRTLPSSRLPVETIPTATPQPSPTLTALIVSNTSTPEPPPILPQAHVNTDINTLAVSPGISILAGVLPVLIMISFLTLKKIKRE